MYRDNKEKNIYKWNNKYYLILLSQTSYIESVEIKMYNFIIPNSPRNTLYSI